MGDFSVHYPSTVYVYFTHTKTELFQHSTQTSRRSIHLKTPLTPTYQKCPSLFDFFFFHFHLFLGELEYWTKRLFLEPSHTHTHTHRGTTPLFSHWTKWISSVYGRGLLLWTQEDRKEGILRKRRFLPSVSRTKDTGLEWCRAVTSALLAGFLSPFIHTRTHTFLSFHPFVHLLCHLSLSSSPHPPNTG